MKTDHFEEMANMLRPMSPKAYQSMIDRNGITPEKINALKLSLERGKELVASPTICIQKNKEALS